MRLRLVARSWLFIAVGLGFTGIEVYGCWEYLHKQQGGVSYLVFLGAAVTAAASLIPMAVEMAYRDRRYFLALLITLAFVPASVTIFLAGVERAGSAKDVTVQAQLDHATKLASALRAEADAKAELEVDEAAARRDCAGGRRAVCKGLEDRAENARQRLAKARLDTVAAGSPPIDAQARRIAAALPVTEQQVQLYGPLILPLTGSLLGVLFLAVGGRLEHEEEITPEPAPDTGSPALEAQEEIAPLQLPEARPLGNIARFMRECLPAAADQRVEIADAYAAYRQWCADENYDALPAAEFRKDYLEVCRRAKIALKHEDGKLYCEGRMLAA